MIVISEELIKRLAVSSGANDAHFLSQDEGDVYSNLLGREKGIGLVPGTIYVTSSVVNEPLSAWGKENDMVRVIVRGCPTSISRSFINASFEVTGFVRKENGWKKTLSLIHI